MPGTTQNLGHYDQVLTGVSHAYMQDAAGFVAGQVFPVVPVNEAAGVYWKIPRGNFFRDDVKKRPMGGRAAITSFNAVTDSYAVEEEALAAVIDDRERANQTNPFNTERSKVRLLTSQHLIHRDRAWVASFFGTSIWGRTVTGIPSGTPTADEALRWNLSTGDPIGVVGRERNNMKKTTGIRPNVLVLGANAYEGARNNPSVLDRIKYTSGAFVTPEILARAFEVDRVVLADAVYNSAAEGATETMGFIAGANDALLCYAATEPGLEVPSAGYIIAWNNLIPGGGMVSRVNRYRDDLAHSDVFEVQTAYQMKLVAADLGTYFTGIVA